MVLLLVVVFFGYPAALSNAVVDLGAMIMFSLSSESSRLCFRR
jgi:hypothetical protein